MDTKVEDTSVTHTASFAQWQYTGQNACEHYLINLRNSSYSTYFLPMYNAAG